MEKIHFTCLGIYIGNVDGVLVGVVRGASVWQDYTDRILIWANIKQGQWTEVPLSKMTLVLVVVVQFFARRANVYGE